MTLIPLKASEPLTIDTYRDFENSPDTIRWRAGWSSEYDGTPTGIELRCYPVLRLTPQGAWVDQHAYHHGNWALSGNKRWVSNDGGMAWAKPTKEDALFSLAYRFSRWSSKLHNDINYYFAISHTLEALLPEHSFRAVDGRGLVRTAAAAPRGAVLTPAPNVPMLPTKELTDQ